MGNKIIRGEHFVSGEKLRPYQIEMIKLIKNSERIITPTPRCPGRRFESRVYSKMLFGNSVLIPDGYNISGVYIDDLSEIEKRIHGKILYKKQNHKQTIPRRQFKRWARGQLK